MLRTSLFGVMAVLAGCAADGVGPGENGNSGRVIDEGTREAAGVLLFLNDTGTTQRLLDIDAALDSRAATNLIAHRNGPDGAYGTSDDNPFDTIAEVDAVSQVGDAALRAILDYAGANGWIASDDPLYGVVEGVTLTQSNAADLLRVANGSTLVELDDAVGLDTRAATGIFNGRPFNTPEAVAAVPYIGASAVNKLVGYGASHDIIILDANVAVPLLTTRVDGLWYSSESDYHMTVWSLPPQGTTVTVANAKTVLAPVYVQNPNDTLLADRFVEETTLARIFDRYTLEEDWWEDSQREDAPKWRAIRATFETELSNPKVFRFGRKSGNNLVGAIDVFVFGVARDGSLVGFRTIAVET